MSEATTRRFADLIERASRGEPAALDELVREYEPKVRVVARVLLGPALRPYLESVDLAQSVHKSILTGLRENRFVLEAPGQLVALALTVLRRKAARHWRHLQRQRRLSGAGPDPAVGLPEVLASLGQGGTDPADAAQFHDQLSHLCLSLDGTERRLIEMRMEGHTPSEIADILGISRVALRVRLTRLRQRLQASGAIAEWL